MGVVGVKHRVRIVIHSDCWIHWYLLPIWFQSESMYVQHSSLEHFGSYLGLFLKHPDIQELRDWWHNQIHGDQDVFQFLVISSATKPTTTLELCWAQLCYQTSKGIFGKRRNTFSLRRVLRNPWQRNILRWGECFATPDEGTIQQSCLQVERVQMFCCSRCSL